MHTLLFEATAGDSVFCNLARAQVVQDTFSVKLGNAQW